MSNLIEKRNRIRQAVPHLASASGSIASFQTDMSANLEEIKIHFNPLQASGTPSPTNVLPITGWTGCDLWRTGKNLFDISIMSSRSGVSVSGNTFVGALRDIYASALVTPIFIPKGTTFIVHCTTNNNGTNTSGNGWAVIFQYENGTRTSAFATLNSDTSPTYYSGTITASDNITGYYFTYYNYGTNIWTINDLQFEIGSTASSYEPFVGNQIPVSWSDTVYGGWIDAIKGVGEYTWECASARWGDIKTGSPDSTTGYYEGAINFSNKILVLHSSSDYGVNTLCNAVPTLLWNDASKTPEHYYGGNVNNKGRCLVFGNFNDDLVIQIAAKLANPIPFTLTPIQLKSLKGTNNVWSNANGNVDVKYWKH